MLRLLIFRFKKFQQLLDPLLKVILSKIYPPVQFQAHMCECISFNCANTKHMFFTIIFHKVIQCAHAAWLRFNLIKLIIELNGFFPSIVIMVMIVWHLNKVNGNWYMHWWDGTFEITIYDNNALFIKKKLIFLCSDGFGDIN